MAQEHALVTIAGQELEVVSLDGIEQVSELFRIELSCRGPAGGLAPGSLIASEAVVTLHDSFGSVRTVTGIVAEAASEHHDDGSSTVRAIIRPPAHLLTLGRNCRSFIDCDVVAIVTRVLGDVPHRWQIDPGYATRAYTVQYREDDWTFISRQLEAEGIYYWFDHSAGSILVLSDQSPAAPDLDGGALIRFLHESGMTASSEMIEEFAGSSTLAPSKFSMGSFDPSRPALKVDGSVGSGMLEIYDAPGGGPASPDECSRQARMRSEGSAAAAAGVAGKTSSVRLAPGRVLEVAGHPVARLDQRYFVTGARYQIRQRRRVQSSTERPYTCRFTGIVATAPFRPPRDTPTPQQAGLQSGVVGGPGGAEIYPDASGQVRVQQHWDREGQRDANSGKWMRVAQRGTADSLQLPRVGWNVLTFNDEGEVDCPSVLARIHDAEHPPAYELPANKTRVVFKTATSPGGGSFNEIYFEDLKGAEEMFINASKDMTVLAQHVKTEAIEHDSTREVGVNHSLTVTEDATEQVVNNQVVSVSANDSTTIGGSYVRTVFGNESASVGGTRSVNSGDAWSTSAGSSRTLSVGAAMVDSCLGSISADADVLNILVGGAVLKASVKSVVEDVGAVSAQTIGGAKLEFASVNRPLEVQSSFYETVGGALVLNSGGTYTDGATMASSWTVGVKMSSEAPATLIEATDEIEITCGSSVLSITPRSIEIRAVKLDLSQATHIETVTKRIEHN